MSKLRLSDAATRVAAQRVSAASPPRPADKAGGFHASGRSVPPPAKTSGAPKPAQQRKPAPKGARPRPPKAPRKQKLSPEERAAREAAEQRQARLADSALAGLLAETWPALFDPSSAPAPLAIGIHKQIREALAGRDGFSRTRLALFLTQWTRRDGYLAAIAAGVPRRNLAGELTGEPTDKHRHKAAEMLKTT